jgi:hypothetical protein
VRLERLPAGLLFSLEREDGSPAILGGSLGPAPSGRSRKMPEWLQGLLQSGLTVIALIVIIMLLAALFMIIFGIATGIDDRIQE